MRLHCNTTRRSGTLPVVVLRAGQLRHLANLSSLLYDLQPDVDGSLLSNDGPDAGGRVANSQNCTLVIAARTRSRWVSGKLIAGGIVAYSTIGAPVSLSTAPPSGSQAVWLDPRTGAMSIAIGVRTDSDAGVIYTPPVAAQKQGNDWVLLIQLLRESEPQSGTGDGGEGVVGQFSVTDRTGVPE